MIFDLVNTSLGLKSFLTAFLSNSGLADSFLVNSKT